MNDHGAFAVMIMCVAAIIIVPTCFIAVGDIKEKEIEARLEEKRIELRIAELNAGITNDLESATSKTSD